MSLLSTTWSYQLQFNFKFRKLPTPLLLLKARISSFDYRHRRLRVLCVAHNKAKSGNESEIRRSGNSSWMSLNTSSDDAAWSDWFVDSQQFGDDSGRKHGIGGILGIGLASILLVAGITSAALSIGKRSRSRPLQGMEPLVEQQEVLLASGNEVYGEEENENDENYRVQDEDNQKNGHHLESKADLQNTVAGSKIEEGLDVVGLNNVDAGAELLSTSEQQGSPSASITESFHPELESSTSIMFPTNSQALDSSATANATLETYSAPKGDIEVSSAVSSKEEIQPQKTFQFSSESIITSVGISASKEIGESDTASFVAQPSAVNEDDENDVVGGTFVSESQSPRNTLSYLGIPAPSLHSAALQVPPGNVLVPGITDQTQSQALAALQVLKVIDSDAQPGDLCTRREYARWLVSASSALSRNLISKVYPAMYIENVSELAFDDITPEDPDFTSIQGLAEAGLISSKLSRRDMLSSPDEDIGSFCFHPDSPLSRQDLVTWKMALEKRQLPEADRKVLHQLSGFIDIDRIDEDACPALVADISAGEQGIVALAFGYTRLFQPEKPVTKGQAAVALATGEGADIVSEELARIEAESIADKAVAAHNALVAEVEKDINASFEKELLMEREKIDIVQKMAEEARKEVERLRADREEENIALMKERASIESEMEALSRLRHELEEQLQSLMTNKVEISYEKERIEKLRKQTEEENQAIIRLQYELEVERNALSMARAWAEDEARRVQEHAKALEEARDRWERQGIKVVVDEDLREEASADTTWINVAKKQLSVEETVDRAETLTDKLKVMAGEVRGKSKEIINKIIQKIQSLISAIKEWISEAGRQTMKFRDVAVAKVDEPVQELQQHAADFGATVKEGAKRVVWDCREIVEKLTQRFKT